MNRIARNWRVLLGGVAAGSAAGAGAIWRAQVQIGHAVVVHDGKPESTSTGTASGHGIQVFTPDGRTVLASRDDFRGEPAIALVDRAIASAGAGARLGLHATHLPDVRPERGRAIPPGIDGIVRIDLLDGARRLADLEREVAATAPGVALKLGLRAEVDAWRIARTDGTDVRFAMPRCTITLPVISSSAPVMANCSCSETSIWV